MSSETPTQNFYLKRGVGEIFAKTAIPIIFVMIMNGRLAITDAIFLGIYIGNDAVGAVATIFPMSLLFIAESTLVGSGMASLLSESGMWFAMPMSELLSLAVKQGKLPTLFSKSRTGEIR